MIKKDQPTHREKKDMKRYAWIAMKTQAIKNCEKSGNQEWYETHLAELRHDMDNTAPSGSGFDNGTRLDYEKTTDNKLVFFTSFHHMNDAGYYTGWTSHEIIVTPDFQGVNIRVTGRNRNNIKGYIAEVFGDWLYEEV